MKNVKLIYFFLVLTLSFGLKVDAQYFVTDAVPHGSSLYYQNDNIGIGTHTPSKQLEITGYHPTVRFQCQFWGPECKGPETSYWDIHNAGNLKFQNYYTHCGDPTDQITVMTMTGTGQVGIMTETPDASAILQIDAIDKGILIPRLTESAIRNISLPATGLLVYNTDIQVFSFYDGTDWQLINTQNDLSDYLTIYAFNTEISNYATNAHLNDTLDYYSTTTEVQNLLNNYLPISDYNNSVAGHITSTDTAHWNAAYRILDTSDFITASSFDTLTNKSGNISMWTNDAGYITEADVQTVWSHTANKTYLKNLNDNVGIGTNTPEKTLHIYAYSKDKLIKSTIRLQNYFKNSIGIDTSGFVQVPGNFAWDIENNSTSLIFSYGHNGGKASALEMQPTVVFDKIGRIGIGTTEPQKQLHIYGQGMSSTLRFEYMHNSKGNIPPDPQVPNDVWDIENNRDLTFSYGSFNGSNGNVSPTIVFTKSGEIGIGTTEPQKQLHLKSADNMPAIRFQGQVNNGIIGKPNVFVPAYWDIQQEGRDLKFNFTLDAGNASNILTVQNGSIGPDKLIVNGEVHAAKFMGDGSGLTNLPIENVWQIDGDNIYYNRGNVGIGTDEPTAPLQIFRNGEELARVANNGYFYCRELVVQKNGAFPDYVFAPEYELMPIEELETYINKNKHLPEVPSEQEVDENGIEVAQMTTILLKKVEELTLYTIEQQKQIEKQQKIIEKQQKQIEKLIKNN